MESYRNEIFQALTQTNPIDKIRMMIALMREIRNNWKRKMLINECLVRRRWVEATSWPEYRDSISTSLNVGNSCGRHPHTPHKHSTAGCRYHRIHFSAYALAHQLRVLSNPMRRCSSIESWIELLNSKLTVSWAVGLRSAMLRTTFSDFILFIWKWILITETFSWSYRF